MKIAQEDGLVKPSQAPRVLTSARLGAVALLGLSPAIARAQEERVMFMVVFLPSTVVMAWVAIRIWTWNASRGAKTRTFFAIALTNVAILMLNWEGGGFPLVMRLGFAAYLLGIVAQIGVPALVWWVCRRREERRGDARIPDREDYDKKHFGGPD